MNDFCIYPINDNEILIETATQKYSQAIQQNANIVVKQGRVFGLESLEKDIKAGTVKVNDNDTTTFGTPLSVLRG